MRILIIEDEQNNADRLMRLVHDIKPDAEELAQALDKVVTENISTTEAIAKILESVGKIHYRERFLIAFRDTYNVVPVSGLEEGDVIVAKGAGFVQEGETVYEH